MLVSIPESAGEGVSPAFNVELTLAGGRNVVHQYRGLNSLQLIQLQLNILQSKERHTVCPGSSDPFYIASLLY